MENEGCSLRVSSIRAFLILVVQFPCLLGKAMAKEPKFGIARYG